MSSLKPIVIDWKNIQTIFLDMDGTLLDLHFDNHFWLEHVPVEYARKENISLQQANTVLAQMYQEKVGTLDWYSLDYWEDALGMDIVALKQDTAHKIAVRTHVEEFLSFIQEQSIRMVLLTNAHPKTVSLKFEHINIEPYFDSIITSHDIGLAKETKGFWDKLLETESFEPTKSLFIDDNINVLREAEAHGIQHLFAIHQPDSQQGPTETEHFTAIECFSQLMGNIKNKNT